MIGYKTASSDRKLGKYPLAFARFLGATSGLHAFSAGAVIL
jgi:hypothetical protein